MNLSFCGCGFLGIYHLGAVRGLLDHGPRLINTVDKVAGASSGALIATALVCSPGNLNDCTAFSMDLARQVRSTRFGPLNPKFNLLDPIAEFLKTYLPDDSYKTASGTLHVSLTAIVKGRLRHEIVSDFASNEDLMEALMISCSIPMYTGLKMPRKNDMMYIDGGFSNNLYTFDEGRTVTVSPFAGEMDIAPTDDSKYFTNVTVAHMKCSVSVQNVTRIYDGFYPPTEKHMLAYFDRGFIDAVNYLKHESMYDKCVNKT